MKEYMGIIKWRGWVMIICLISVTSFDRKRDTGTMVMEMPLYTGAIPNATGLFSKEVKEYHPEVDSVITNVSVPTLTLFKPDGIQPNAPAVIICPGGGYHALLITREGKRVAKAFNENGIVAFVLKYRLPDDKYMKDKSIAPLQDAQRAIQLVREHAKEWGIDPAKIGIMGFSAGGHLAATAAVHFDTALIENKKQTNLRPDFAILVNPVISFNDTTGHIGSRTNLLGATPSPQKINFFSNELHIHKNTPPCFLVHNNDDTVVPLANSMEFFYALKKNAVSAELHVYAQGDHGFLQDTPPFGEWFGRSIYWMKSKKWI